MSLSGCLTCCSARSVGVIKKCNARASYRTLDVRSKRRRAKVVFVLNIWMEPTRRFVAIKTFGWDTVLETHIRRRCRVCVCVFPARSISDSFASECWRHSGKEKNQLIKQRSRAEHISLLPIFSLRSSPEVAPCYTAVVDSSSLVAVTYFMWIYTFTFSPVNNKVTNSI